ncbi:hypothetical protein FG386_001277 [Cryptosporidium ryanae]|uniref:uncharacterized protein n=1 Tax=Cryptosporidium ryanae TaxID=515981 RepID=UPI00351A7487|nr:hypothetical protein FG386_001277 [Cryptosporidium ryanae]
MINSTDQLNLEPDLIIKTANSDIDMDSLKANSSVKFSFDVTKKGDLKKDNPDFESEDEDKLIEKYVNLDRSLNYDINNIFKNEAFMNLLEEYDVLGSCFDSNFNNHKSENILELNKLLNEEKYSEIHYLLIEIKDKYIRLNDSFLAIKKKKSCKNCLIDRIKENEIKFNSSNSRLNNPVLVLDAQSNNCNDLLKLLLLDMTLLNNNFSFKDDELLVTKELIYDMLSRNRMHVFTNNIDILVKRHIDDNEVLNKKDQDYYYIESMLRNRINSIYNENMHLKEKINYDSYIIKKKEYEIGKLTTILNSIQGQIDDSISEIRSKLKSKYGNYKSINGRNSSDMYSSYLRESKFHSDYNCSNECEKEILKSEDYNFTVDDIHIQNKVDSCELKKSGANLISQNNNITKSNIDMLSQKKEVNAGLIVSNSVLTPIETEHIFVENVNIKTQLTNDNKVNSVNNNEISDFNSDQNSTQTELCVVCEGGDVSKGTEKDNEIKTNIESLHQKIETNENTNIIKKSDKRHNIFLQNYRAINRRDIKSTEPNGKSNEIGTNKVENIEKNNAIRKSDLKEKIVFGDKKTSSINKATNSTNIPVSKKRTKSRERNIFERSTFISNVGENSNLMFKTVTKNDVFLFNTSKDSVFNELNESNESAKLLSRRSLKKVSGDLDSIISRAKKNKDTLLIKDTVNNNVESQKNNKLPHTSKVYKATIQSDIGNINNLKVNEDSKSKEKGSNIGGIFNSNEVVNAFPVNSEIGNIYNINNYLESTEDNSTYDRNLEDQKNEEENELDTISVSNEFTDGNITNDNETKIRSCSSGNTNSGVVNSVLNNSSLLNNIHSEKIIIQRNNTAPLISYEQYQKYFPFNSNNYITQLNSYNSMPQYINSINTNGLHYVGYGTIPNNIALQGMNKNLLTSVPTYSNNIYKTDNNNLGAN